MKYIVEVENVNKTYNSNGKRVEALRDLSLKLKTGKITALLGPNGSGKTTLIKGMCGLLSFDKGSVTIQGISSRDDNILNNVGAILEGERNIYYYLTVYENLFYFGKLNRIPKKQLKKKIVEVLELLHIIDKKNTYVSDLSRGMQQKVSLAIILIKDSEVLLLDEPTLGLDVSATIDLCGILLEMCRNKNKTILLTTHQLEVAEKIADEIIFLNHGKVITHELKNDIINDYSSHWNWLIELSHPLNSSIVQAIEPLCEYNIGSLNLRTNTNDLSKLLNMLEEKNIEINNIEKEIVSLTDIFLEITKENKND